jgi:hypothetical protein
MNRFLALLLLAFVVAPSLTCGSSGRHLQSIAISKRTNGTQIDGNFFVLANDGEPARGQLVYGTDRSPTDAVLVHVHAAIRGQLHRLRGGSSRG